MRTTKIDAQIAQYFMRQAFEEGYRAARGPNVTKDDWFPWWVKSQTRAALVANGIIDHEVTFR